MPDAVINGITIHWEEWGTGFPVLLTHGYGATGRMWRGQGEALGDRYRIIAWDMRGHGGTDSPPDPKAYSEALTVADMAGLLDHLGERQAVVGGLSLGGYMSLAFYVAHPERVRALILCDTGPGYRNADARAQWNDFAFGMAKRLREEGLEALRGSAEIEATRALHRSAEGLAMAAEGMLAQFDSRIIDALPSIAVPTLIIVGEHDKRYFAGTDYMAAKIPGARKVVVPGAGHAANIDQPEFFNRTVREFLESVGL
jgi:pimeloyl-ACP methyl ester carboxylesterase